MEVNLDKDSAATMADTCDRVLGRYAEHHHSWGQRRYRVDYVLGDYWTEYATTPHEETAKVLAGILLRTGRKVRISRTHECIELGVPVSPDAK